MTTKTVLHYEANADASDDEGLIFEYEVFGKVLRFDMGYDRDGPHATVTAIRDGEEAAVGSTGFNGDLILVVDFVKGDDLL
jgi:hypothetical protein